jgi:hypothetical protein
MEENQIINPVRPDHPGGQNAEGQEQAPIVLEATETATATTNAPAAESQTETPQAEATETSFSEPVNEVKIEEPIEEKFVKDNKLDVAEVQE